MYILRKQENEERKSVLQLLYERVSTSKVDTAVVPSNKPRVIVPSMNDQQPKAVDSKGKKRKIDLAVEGHYCKVSLDSMKSSDADSAGGSSGSSSGDAVRTSGSLNRFDAVTGEGWKCNFCGRVISTEQVRCFIICLLWTY